MCQIVQETTCIVCQITKQSKFYTVEQNAIFAVVMYKLQIVIYKYWNVKLNEEFFISLKGTRKR